ncbi:unnamed protein product [Caenorhabditis bovis]|uniref:Metallo-beta-lactamase domain-containing protein n=1 Tax=Caenorhabditis bovis TaxID=2654633 RepID=A0A8S1FAR1_9PELO|nr:unnamed protein product [Caenorhabditis bovis]
MASNSSGSDEASNEYETPVIEGNRFENPPSFRNWSGLPAGKDVWKYFVNEKNLSNVPSDENELNKTLPVKHLKKFESTGSLYAAWLGHATMLVHLEGVNLITDPIWAARASMFSFAGPKRYRPPPMRIEELPMIDIGVISHDHYDHLDQEAVKTISRQNEKLQWFVPMGMKEWFKSIGIANSDAFPNRVTEMTWGEAATFRKSGETFTLWCLPAQHWGRRGLFDKNQRLWCGWCLVGPNKKFYYTGDTGFCDTEFKKIGQRLGPIDLAAIPIGAYCPRFFMKSQHIDPDEAVAVHELIRAKTSIGIHWGTYHMGSYEFYLEPRQRIEQLMKTRGGKFITIAMGEIWDDEN